ncbi:CLUMA_CG001164, isoform A [Clunio marinus]|uniref:Serine/threonine-protein kinase receptor n=1 Tax=Clunio marinus TaxID=568069 RepID=A0A1J1HIH9_9DIPT|nr:CLUMA_CG001164, isoform A [Clunio marinus]
MKKMKLRSTFLFGFLMLMISAASTLPTFGDDHEDNEHEKSYHPEMTITCEYYNAKDCKKEPCLPKKITCPDSNGKRQGCFVLWGTNNMTEQPIVEMKDCFIFHDDCNQSECIDYKYEKSAGKNFCCCRHDMCNREFVWKPTPTEPSTTENVNENEKSVHLTDTSKWIWASFLLLSLIGFCIASRYIYHQRKQIFKEIPTAEPELSVSSQCLYIRPIDLIEIKAHGRFGVVWKGKMPNGEVAVKVFSPTEKKSWITEQEIYKLPRMNHPNILHFIGAEKHIFQDGKTEFWLITQYQPLGSLCDYLKSHTVNWQELCKIAESMARGLMHLHEEIPGTRTDELKPAIAHRDFKSKNVLLKPDLTACIADFGLALRFTPGQTVGDLHGQVGTRRYMAPEILDGAINFNRDSFLRIDVYACGLVLWELVSRCSAHGGPVADYRLPFEMELGLDLHLEDMQENVAAKKLRPRIYEEWRTHSGLNAVCETIEECWDHDQEARLSSSCIMERLSQHSRYKQIAIDTTTTTNNFISINNTNDQ